MNRRSILLLSAAFLTGAFFAGPAAHVFVPRLAAAYADVLPQSDDRARELALFGEVMARVQADYVQPVTTKALIGNALNGMLSGLDPHSGYLDAKQWHEMQVETQGRFGGLGMTVTGEDGLLKVVSPIDGTPASRAGIKPGDLITAVDGKTIEGLTLTEAVDRLRGPPDTQVHITIKRQGDAKPIELTLTREIIHMQVVKSQRYGNIGYVRLAEFNDETDRGLRDAIAVFRKQDGSKLDGLILDLRNNPGGLLDQAVAVSDDFLTSGKIVSTKGRQPDDTQVWRAHGGDMLHGLPIVVMINDGSASASEIVSGALQDHNRAVLLGTRSFGKGSVQTLFPLRNGGAIRLTTARYYTPDGRSIQGKGIEPDVVVHESDNPQPEFGPAHEWDLNNTISNSGGVTNVSPRRSDLPIAAGIPEKPPKDWPKLDPDKPDTDFQLHEALILARRMVADGNLGQPVQRVSR
ncbi:MAG TPA: S41 family peptidase [Acetobacteraceae bacterium]|jgi:carboxyl-terminal processing protease